MYRRNIWPLLIACVTLLMLSGITRGGEQEPAPAPEPQETRESIPAEALEKAPEGAEEALSQAGAPAEAEQPAAEGEQEQEQPPEPVDVAELARAAKAVNDATQAQIQALNRLRAAAPEHAREAIRQLMEVAQQVQTRAEEALELAQAGSAFQQANLHWKHARIRIAQMQQVDPKQGPRLLQLIALQYCDAFDDTYASLRQAETEGQNVAPALQAMGAHQQHHAQVLQSIGSQIEAGARAVIAAALERAERGPTVALHPPEEKAGAAAEVKTKAGEGKASAPRAVQIRLPSLPPGKISPEMRKAIEEAQRRQREARAGQGGGG